MSDDAEFADWWHRVGKSLDPDTEDVSWYDKRQAFAEAAFHAAMAISRNYVCDEECEPTEALFTNRRIVRVDQNEDGKPFLQILLMEEDDSP